MKLIKYTLTAEGTIPEYVTDGGYLPVKNDKAWPQDLDLVGVALDSASQAGFANKAALTAYIQNNGIEFKNEMTNEVTPVSTVVDSLWAKLTR
jgi:hypothetical protein